MKYFIPSTSKAYSLRHLILSLISRKERNLDLCIFFILTTPDNLLNRFILGSFYFSLLNQQKSMENKAYPSCVKHMHPVLYMANSYLLCSSMVFLLSDTGFYYLYNVDISIFLVFSVWISRSLPMHSNCYLYFTFVEVSIRIWRSCFCLTLHYMMLISFIKL